MSSFTSQETYRDREEGAGASTMANPVPLGLLALALTTALLGANYTHILIPSALIGIGTVTAPAIFYGGLVQLLAGMWAFRKNQPLAATLFSAYGGFLIAFGALPLPLFGLITLFGADTLAFNHALGLLFLCWTISSLILLMGAFRSNIAFLPVILGCLTFAYLFLTIGELANANGPLLAIGGWLAIICALLAWYSALATFLQTTNSPFQLPMGGRANTPLTPEHHYGGEPAV